MIGEHIAACHIVLTVQDAMTVVQKTCKLLTQMLTQSYEVSEKEDLWECLLQTDSVKEHQDDAKVKKIGRKRKIFCNYLKAILNDWSPSDSILLKQVSEEALKELKKLEMNTLKEMLSLKS